MTDLELWRAFAIQAGVATEAGDPPHMHTRDDVTIVRVTEGTGPKNTGYRGFLARLVFDVDGGLMEFGVWE